VYIHQNPLRARWVEAAEHYPYSSAVNYAGGKGLLDISVIDIAPTIGYACGDLSQNELLLAWTFAIFLCPGRSPMDIRPKSEDFGLQGKTRAVDFSCRDSIPLRPPSGGLLKSMFVR
jgi:hypothetical protein